MIQPLTENPVVELVDNLYSVSCKTNGADIVYRYIKSADKFDDLVHWKV